MHTYAVLEFAKLRHDLWTAKCQRGQRGQKKQVGKKRHGLLLDLEEILIQQGVFLALAGGLFVSSVGVDRLSAWPIIGADIKHFTDYRYRPF